MGMGNALAAEGRVTNRSASASALSKARRLLSSRRTRAHSGAASDCGTALSTADLQAEQAARRLSSARGRTLAPTTEEDETSARSTSARSSDRSHKSDEAEARARRVREAEKILAEVAKEYAAKRAAGLVPSKPVPARTLLWQELERRARTGFGRRGQCVFGRDNGDSGVCGCTNYKKLKRLPDGRENAGGVCECCGHGAVWHRLTGGVMAASSASMGLSASHNSTRSSLRARARSGNSQSALEASGSVYSLASDYYDDSEYDSDEDEDEDDEDIALEVARPYAMMEDPTPPLTRRSTGGGSRSDGDAAALDRASLFSNGDSFGLPPRLSSTSRHLDKLLGAIAKYRAQGLSEDEIEQRIRQDFPPTEQRVSYVDGQDDSGLRASQ